MKKILILQLLGKSFGGVWQVNKMIGEKFISLGYDVSVVFLRDNQNDLVVTHDPKLRLFTINPIDNWDDIPRKKDVLKFNVSPMKYVYEYKKLRNDFKELKNYIKKYDPDYIINSHYQLLDGIPKDYLCKTIHEQHTAFSATYSHLGTRKILNKYNNKVLFVWLSKASCEEALNKGYNNSYYIYNAVRFDSNRKSSVVSNKKLVTITRLSYEKRIDLMIEIVNDILKDNKLKDWILEIYGTGPEEDKLKILVQGNNNIKMMGRTDNPKDVLLSSSINLNTSLFEGFSLSILEANECGVPTISFDFGESSSEEIINNKTGIIANDINSYKNKLKELMLDNNMLKEMSIECKKFNKNFKIDNIINKWLELFKIIDNR